MSCTELQGWPGKAGPYFVTAQCWPRCCNGVMLTRECDTHHTSHRYTCDSCKDNNSLILCLIFSHFTICQLCNYPEQDMRVLCSIRIPLHDTLAGAAQCPACLVPSMTHYLASVFYAFWSRSKIGRRTLGTHQYGNDDRAVVHV